MNRSTCAHAVCMISDMLENFAWRGIPISYLIIDIVINLRIMKNLPGNGEEERNSIMSNILMFCISYEEQRSAIYRLYEEVVRLSIFMQCTENDSFILANREDFSHS